MQWPADSHVETRTQTDTGTVEDLWGHGQQQFPSQFARLLWEGSNKWREVDVPNKDRWAKNLPANIGLNDAAWVSGCGSELKI